MKSGGYGVIALGVASLAFGVYAYVDSKDRAEKAERKNDEQMAKQEARAKVMNLKDHNRNLQQINSGYLIAKNELIDKKREQAADLRNYGAPKTA